MKTSKRAALLSPTLAAALLLGAAPAFAETDESKVAEASTFFDAGAQAYKAGQYVIAAEAFLKAHELAPSPSLLFSAAQAYRRQYLSEPGPLPLHKAIGLYRDYLRIDKSPKRREDAMQALATLVPMEARFTSTPNGEALVGTPAPPPDPAAATRLLLTSAADGAEVSVDGGPFVPAPYVARVRAGAHRVAMKAPGYDDQELSVDAVNGELVPRHVALRPKPARLHITGTSGAGVSIDGRVKATLPLDAPIAVAPGSHFITVTLPGHVPFAKNLDLERDQSRDLAVDLGLTRQRVAAFATLGAGAAGAVATGVLAGLALGRQGTAQGLKDQQSTTPLTADQRDQYNSALQARDDFAHAASVTGAVSALALSVGLGLFAFDRPEIPPPAADKPSENKGPRVEFDVGVLSMQVRGTF
jgi:PEGA domain